ncbi:DoxX family membrane protein [Actinomadura sp. NPDC047616]|uniref:DoxX family protein n=1 Tax=Actinomadura sp. NPDC047616 TaxID=3155914 RepID=UPI0034052E6C
MRTRPVYDIAALLARLGVGAVFLAHGWQKIEVGITATGRSFDQLGVPAPTAAAIYATFAELLGGLALIAGLGLPVAGTVLFLDMAGAFVFIHAGNGLFLVDDGKVANGFELVLVLGLASLLFAAGAGGQLTLDRRLFPSRADRSEQEAWPPPEDPSVPWPSPDEPEALEAGPARSGGTAQEGAARTTRPDIPVEPTRRRGAMGRSGRDLAASQTDSADAADVPVRPPAEPKGGRRRRKTKADREGSTASTPDVPDEGAPTASGGGSAAPTGEPPAEGSPGAPRLAADIINDVGGDVRVAGKRKPSKP